MRFVILEIDEGKAVVIDQEGAFRSLPAREAWAVGMELDESALEEGRAKHPPRFFRAASAVAACLAIGICFGVWLTRSVESYVDVSINPAVRISVNRYGRVITAESINADGLSILSAIAPSKDLNETVRAIVLEAESEGYLKTGGNGIRLTVASKKPDKAQAMEKALLRQVDALMAESGISTSVRAQKLSTADYENLRKELTQALSQDASAQLESVYTSNTWNSGQSFWLEEIEYEGNGLLELEFSRTGVWTGNERVAIVAPDGMELPTELVAQEDDEWSVRCDGLEDGVVYDVRIEGMEHAGAFDGCFRANPDSETEQTHENSQPNAHAAADGVARTDDDDDDDDHDDDDDRDDGESDEHDEHDDD